MEFLGHQKKKRLARNKHGKRMASHGKHMNFEKCVAMTYFKE
jgi:hypothetical protein